MEWWYYGPIVLAVVMFLLVGTICERRIEAAVRRILERRRELLQNRLLPQTEQARACSTTDLRPQPTIVKHSATQPAVTGTASQRTIGTCRTNSLLADSRTLEVQS